MSTRFWIATLLSLMVNAVVFFTGLIAVLLVPTLAAHAEVLIPAVVVTSFVVAAPIAWLLAPRMRARYWRSRRSEALA